jgi:DNA-binding CsgD family transcriptional regulator
MLKSDGSPLEQAIMARQTIHQILESTAEPAYSVDAQGLISGWNAAAESLLGHSGEAVVGKPCHNVLRGNDVFGNRYCEPDCPLMLMARLRAPIRHFQMDVCRQDDATLRVLCFAIRIPEEQSGAFSLLHLLRPAQRSWPKRIERDLDGAPQVTKRELMVLRLLANGHSTREIATVINISPSTARKHVQNLFGKLDVHSRLAAVLVAFEKGIL